MRGPPLGGRMGPLPPPTVDADGVFTAMGKRVRMGGSPGKPRDGIDK